jgi:hypothetical protein
VVKDGDVMHFRFNVTEKNLLRCKRQDRCAARQKRASVHDRLMSFDVLFLGFCFCFLFLHCRWPALSVYLFILQMKKDTAAIANANNRISRNIFLSRGIIKPTNMKKILFLFAFLSLVAIGQAQKMKIGINAGATFFRFRGQEVLL